MKVVKALNTMNAFVMADPSLVGRRAHRVRERQRSSGQGRGDGGLASFGWKHVLDLGDITTARGAEMYLPLWLRIWGALGSGTFNIAVAQ